MHALCLSLVPPLYGNCISCHSINCSVSHKCYSSKVAANTTVQRGKSSCQATPILLRRPQKPSSLKFETLNPPTANAVQAPHEKKYDSDQDDHRSLTTKTDSDSQFCSPTDILQLMDGLQLPIEDELYCSLIRECTETLDVGQGTIIHSHIQQNRHHLLRQPSGLVLTNLLLIMYITCGKLERAYQLFEQMLLRDATSWVTIIVAFCSNREHQAVLRLFVNMCTSGGIYRLLTEPSCSCLDVLVAAFRSCAQLRELKLAQQIHGLAFKVMGGCDSTISSDVNNSLVQLYSIVGHHHSAVKVFRRIGAQDAATWTRMITDYTRIGQFRKAIFIFREMLRSGRGRNFHVFSSSLVACGKVGDKGFCGKQVHACAIKLGVDYDQFAGTSLVTMYINHGLLSEAERAFEFIDGVKDAACWNSLILGYARNGCDREALRLVNEMRASGVEMKELMVNDVITALGNDHHLTVDGL